MRGARGNLAYSKQSGLQILVDSTWAGSRGYRPVRVTASMAQPATADTEIVIEFFAGTWRSDNRSISVEHVFELSQGATTATAEFSVPQYLDWNGFGWDIWVDGVKDDMLCLNTMRFNGGTSGTIAVGQLAANIGQWRGAGSALVQAVSSGSVDDLAINFADLPDHWTDYSSLDVVTTTVDMLETQRVSAPEKLSALLRWVRAGGNLWVLDVGQDFTRLAEVDRILAPNSSDEQVPATNEEMPLDNWRFSRLGDTGRKRLNHLVSLTMDEPDEDRKLSLPEIMDSKFADTAVDSRQWFVARAYGLGTIVAIQEVELRRRGNSTPLVQAIQRSALVDNLRWSTRHGNNPGTGNPNFNNWLIADVGAAPVGEFQLLISLFVIGIGPVNYWLLKRRNQLPVLLLTVPLAALATTLMLFAYGFLADGIGARVRARSLTVLDQQAGESASWARLSYYAGIAPSEGLQMPQDTTVYPIEPPRSDYTPFGRRRTDPQKTLVWDNDQQLAAGWLGSRTPTQYLTVTARPTRKELAFAASGEALKVTNQLGTSVKTLIVQDHDGNFFLGENIDDQAQAQLEPCDHSKAASTLRRLLTENLPELPPGYVENTRRRRNNDFGNSFAESLMELQIEAINEPTAKGWGNGSYLAVTEAGIELSLGLDDIEETNSFHLVRGSW